MCGFIRLAHDVAAVETGGRSMNRKELEEYIAETYSTYPEYPWADAPDYAVFRHSNNRKWFALVMDIPKERLGLTDNGLIDILNVKGEPVMIDFLKNETGFFPAYHMNKTNWITIALDGSVPSEKVKMLLDMSFDLTAQKVKRRRKEQDV